MFQVIFKNPETGAFYVKECVDKKSLNQFKIILERASIEYEIKDTGEEMYQIVRCIFKASDINDEERIYSFANPNKIGNPGDIVKASGADGKCEYIVTIIESKMMFVSDIKSLCKKIGCKKLGKIKQLIWTAKK